MPLYEYRCNACRRRVTILVRDFSGSVLACPECGSTRLKRLFSRFAIVKSEQTSYGEILSDSQLVKGLENDDPRALAQWNKKMSGEAGGDTDPEYAEMLDRMEAGEPPESPAEKEPSSGE